LEIWNVMVDKIIILYDTIYNNLYHFLCEFVYISQVQLRVE